MAANVVWVLAYKMGGVYVSHEYIIPDIVEGIEEASKLVEEDPSCDPKLIQVILDPANQALAEADTLSVLEERLSKTPPSSSEYLGLQAAITTLKDRSVFFVGDADMALTPREAAEEIIDRLDLMEDMEESDD